MTPTATPDVSSSPPPSGGNSEDRFTSAFSSALSSESEPSQAAPVEEPAQAAPEIAEPETSAEGADATATEPEPGVGEDDPYADLDDPGDQTAIEAFLKTPRGREVYQGYKFVQELTKPYAQGGIGHVPTIQDVRQYFSDHRNALAMRNDFSSGDPAQLGKFFHHWFGPDQNGRPRASSMAALEHLEPTLAKFGADVYGQIADPVMSRYQNTLVDKWRAAPAEEKPFYWHAAQQIHHDLTGKWLPNDLGGGAPARNGGQPAPDPDRAALDAEWQRLNQAKQVSRQEIQGQWNAKLEQSESSALAGQIDQALKPLATMKQQTPELYESLKERMAGQIRAAIQGNPELWDLYQAKVNAARRTGNPSAIEPIMKDFVALVIPAIREKRNSFLKGAGVVIKQQNGDKLAQLRSIASNVAPSNNGAPPQRSVVPSSKPKPGESRDDYRERRLMEAMRI